MKKLLSLTILTLLSVSIWGQGYNSKGGTHRGHSTPYTQYQPSSWSGSGIAIGTRLVATNHHVVDGATNLAIYFPDQDKTYSAEVVTTDPVHDLAVIRVVDQSFRGFHDMKYGFKTDQEDVGMGVFVLGYPLVQTMGTEIKLTTGVVSSRSGYEGDRSQYQISAPVQPGNSGGPLFNDNGELIGIVSAKHTQAENVSYGVKLSYLYELAGKIEGVNFSRTSKISHLSLSEKCKSVIPFTVMILADNQISHTTQTSQTRQTPQPSAQSRAYPIRKNSPSVERSGTSAVNIFGIEVTEDYTAVYMSYTNTQYKSGWYSIDKRTYIVDPRTGQRYMLIGRNNCPVSPEQADIQYNQTVEFTLYFESIPSNARVIDLIEPGNSTWQFYGIQLY